MHKIILLNKDRSSTNSKVDRVFEDALLELHNSLVSNYSLTLQVYTFSYVLACMHAYTRTCSWYNVMVSESSTDLVLHVLSFVCTFYDFHCIHVQMYASLCIFSISTYRNHWKQRESKRMQSNKTKQTANAPPPVSDVDHRVTITFAQLATNIFKGNAKRQGLGDPGYLAISVNQMKSFLDEFSKGRLVP